MFPGLALFTVMTAQLARSWPSSSRRGSCLLTLLIAGMVALCGGCLLAALLLVVLHLKGGVG